MTEPAILVVKRSRSMSRDFVRRYKIELDGEVIGAVARGKQLRTAMSSGPHRVRALIDWTGSPVVEFTATPGEEVVLSVAPSGNAFQFGQALDADTYLTLTVS